MCQLLGMNCNTPTDITFSFTGFAQRGGKTDHHGDGWGVAFFEGGSGDSGGAAKGGAQAGKGLRHFVDHSSAATSPVAQLISRYPIKSHNVIAHIRKATQGVVALENCHPFVRELWGRHFVFAHNGTVRPAHLFSSGSHWQLGHVGLSNMTTRVFDRRELAEAVLQLPPFNALRYSR